MKLSEIINELFESPEMAEYLIDRSEELARYDILQMVCKAPIDIRRKAEILAELSKSENIEKEISEEIKKYAARQSGYRQYQRIFSTKFLPL